MTGKVFTFKKSQPVINIQLRVPGQPNKVEIDGVDYSHVSFLALRIQGGGFTEMMFGTNSPDTFEIPFGDEEVKPE